MIQLPELIDDAVIELTLDGGFAYIPHLTGQRRILLSRLNTSQRGHVCHILSKALTCGELDKPTSSVGRNDQRYYRIQISYPFNHNNDTVILVPEDIASPELTSLWRYGE